MSIVNKYSRWYHNIINAAKIRPAPQYERHHILPKSWGGSNDHSNMVLLTMQLELSSCLSWHNLHSSNKIQSVNSQMKQSVVYQLRHQNNLNLWKLENIHPKEHAKAWH